MWIRLVGREVVLGVGWGCEVRENGCVDGFWGRREGIEDFQVCDESLESYGGKMVAAAADAARGVDSRRYVQPGTGMRLSLFDLRYHFAAEALRAEIMGDGLSF